VKVASLIVRPTISSLENGTNVIDFTSMVEIMGNHDADDDTRWQTITPICESLAIQFSIVRERADRGQPALMALRQPGEKLIVRTRARASSRD
jgi:hypothetical protein